MPSKRTTILAFVLIFLAGLGAAAFECRWMYHDQRERLTIGALHNANAFPLEELALLTGTPADAATPRYGKLKRDLAAARASHQAIGYVSLLRFDPAGGRVVCLAAAGLESEGARIPGAGAPRDGTSDAAAARELASGRVDVAVNLFHRDWGNKYWVSGYARCDGHAGPVAFDDPPFVLFRYDVDASYWFASIGESVLVRLLGVWLLLGLPFAAYLLGKRHRLRALQIVQLSEAIAQTDTAIMIAHTDASGIKYANRCFCEMVGYTFEELHGKRWRDLRTVEPTDTLVARRCAMVFEGITVEAEWDFRRKDGYVFPVRATVTPVRNKSGKVVEAIFVVTDITEHRRQALLLRKEKEKAEDEDHTKTLLIAATNNEVRAPLAEIDRLSRELTAMTLTTEQSGYAATIRKSSVTLTQLTQDIIDFSSIDTGRLRIEPVIADPRNIINETLDMLRAEAAARKIRLLCKIAPEVPPQIIIAADRLRQVLLNLTGNAIKFTHGGEVEIRLKILNIGSFPAVSPDVIASVEKFKKEGRVTLLFAVRDTGIGMSHESLKKLFDPFWQADSGSARRYDGAGLGLPISRQLVELLGGEINVESKPGSGTTFYFSVTCTLPRKEAGAAAP